MRMRGSQRLRGGRARGWPRTARLIASRIRRRSGDAPLGGAGLDGVDQRLRQAHVDAGGLGFGLAGQGLEGGEVEALKGKTRLPRRRVW